ncbi:MAG: nickel-responsive transcriptional regulator NikR [Candidatus Bathyarchaeota archaeon]|nr:MAG: nickel-responsive transcriptional regulator NikR [Candidatus Bathyarchaeota archaeon]
MSKIIRVGVTFPPDLLKELDKLLQDMGYESRSKAIQDSVRVLVNEYRWIQEQKGTRVGVLVMLYDHEAKGLDASLIDAQHEHSNVIYSSMHIHLSERNCLETIAVKGKAEEIIDLVRRLKTKRGVKSVKLSIVS